ncbi:acyltransferase [Aggregatimonas sangjinii]|uniref:Acyltransferase n=1 Tax=Aggregatimonas sangjinii TaxID=2583587 RepID=A0A5B7SR12_9FLAO|nr:acyltransferase [Aggregatimonas sangjinii]QCX00672.1 acyltransferase [Aggregatimonas sangjinii]
MIKVLDGLRGFAALAIVISHFPRLADTGWANDLYHLVGIFRIGYLSVDIFFVLSGFLITRILIKEKKEKTFSFCVFYLKRAIRIFPIYYLSILICGFLFSWEGMEYLALYGANYYFMYEHSDHPLLQTWSLSVEEHFYILWPFIMYLFQLPILKKMVVPVVLGTVLISCWCAYLAVEENALYDIVYHATQFRILSLGIGCFLAFNEQKLAKWEYGKVILWLVPLTILTLCVGAFVPYLSFVSNVVAPFIQLFLFSLCSACIFLIVLLQENRNGSLHILFGNRAIGFIGKISYGIYLYHYPVFYYFGVTYRQIGEQVISATTMFLPLFLVMAISIASFYLIERPLAAHRGKIVQRFLFLK